MKYQLQQILEIIGDGDYTIGGKSSLASTRGMMIHKIRALVEEVSAEEATEEAKKEEPNFDNFVSCKICGKLLCGGNCTDATAKSSAKEVEKAIQTIFSQLNKMGNEKNVANAVALTVLNEHRTLQQLFANHVLRAIIDTFAYENTEGYCDARNMTAGQLGTELKKTMDRTYMPYI